MQFIRRDLQVEARQITSISKELFEATYAPMTRYRR